MSAALQLAPRIRFPEKSSISPVLRAVGASIDGGRRHRIEYQFVGEGDVGGSIEADTADEAWRLWELVARAHKGGCT